jgi:predicted RNase H-like HicB family nuclease
MMTENGAILERSDGWYVAYAREVRGANGQGRTPGEALENLREAVALILEDRREAPAGPLLRHPLGR